MRTISLERARRMALAAQGLAAARPGGRVDIRHLRRVMGSVGALQIDSVNVVARAHLLTLFTRLGAFDAGLLDRALERRRLFEYWGHAASYLPIEDWPLFRARMEGMRPWGGVRRLEADHPGFVDRVLEEVRERGPLTASDLADGGERRGNWWGWSDGKLALEWLFASGRVTVAHRENFTRYYDLPERVIPEDVRARPSPGREDAHRSLLLRAAASMGVATASDLADYYRINIRAARPAVDALASEGSLERVAVEGWKDDAFVHPEAVVPRAAREHRLVGPFDSLVWSRERTERLFGFRYRIEIYVPEPEREYGYYVFPFLTGGRLAARVDLKADRGAGVLRVRGAFAEEGADRAAVARELAAELGEMCAWLGLGEVSVDRRGGLAGDLRTAL
jgi:uncharacterized protein YcaQ